MTKVFLSPAKFSEHLIKAATVELLAINKGLQEVAELVHEEAQKELGHLQPQVGPFAAWEELADSTKAWKESNDYVFNSDYNPLLNTGKLRDSIQYEVNMPGLYAIVGSKYDVAAFQEFGTSRGLPPRPFIGPAFFKNKNRIAKIFGSALLVGIAGGNVIQKSIGQELGYHQDIKL
jgi:HK97 gp10 family phage protein